MYKVGLLVLAVRVEDFTFTQLAASGFLLGGHSSFHFLFHYPYIAPYYPIFHSLEFPQKGKSFLEAARLRLGGAGFRVHEAVR